MDVCVETAAGRAEAVDTSASARTTEPRNPVNSWAYVTAEHKQVRIEDFAATRADVEKFLVDTTVNLHADSVSIEDNPPKFVLSFPHPYLATAAMLVIQHRGALVFSAPAPALASVETAPDLSMNSDEAIDQLMSDDEYWKASASAYSTETRSTGSTSEAASGRYTSTSNSLPAGSSTVSNMEYLDELESEGIIITSLPIAAYSKARRILLPSDSQLPIMSVSMRADINFFDRSTMSRLSRYSLPNDSDACRVVDAVMLGEYGLIGYNGKTSQVAIINHKDKDAKPKVIKLPQLAHTLPEKETSEHHKYTSAITCIAAKAETTKSIKFLTGGSDKEIRMWTLGKGSRQRVEHEKLLMLQTVPQAFACRENMLWVGSSTRLCTVDLNKPSILSTARLSNGIHNIHQHSQAPSVRILEVDHIDYQIQIFDDRKKSGFSRPPDILFGARAEGSLPNRRHSRGDTSLSLYAKGFPDGTVKIWDYRNAKKPAIAHSFRRRVKVTHCVFADPSTLLCYSDKELVTIDLNKVPAC